MMSVAGGWDPEAISTLVVGVAAALLALSSMVMQVMLWRRDGPMVRALVLPAVQTAPDTFVIGVHPNDLKLGGNAVVALSLFSTGRQPVYVAHVFFETVQPIRKRRWWWPDYGERATRQVGVGDYLGKGRPGRIEPTDRLDLLVRQEDLAVLAAQATKVGLPDDIRAVVILGSGTVVRSKPYSLRLPPQGVFEEFEPVVAGR
jgi:hypothetical protein